MNPEDYPTLEPQQPVQMETEGDYKKRIRGLIILASAAVLVFIAFGVFDVHNLRQFRVTGTNPDTSSVSTISPFFNVSFNKQLSDNGLLVSASNGIIESYKVDGDTLDINLNNPLSTNTTYTVTVKSIYDTAGEQITDKVFTFKPQDIPFDQLPNDQQQAIKNQSPPAADQNPVNTTFNGFDELVNHGISTDQVNDLLKAFGKFAPHAKTVTITANSISPAPHNPNVDTTFATNFTVSVDSKTYSAKISYFDTSSLTLILKDSSGKQVFDSGNISPSD